MKVIAKIIQKNSLYNPKVKESEKNIENLWEDEFEIPENYQVVKIEPIESSVYQLKAEFEGKEKSYEIPNMNIYNLLTANNELVYQFAISKNSTIKESIHHNNDDIKFLLNLTDQELFYNPIPGVYIHVQDLPEEIIEFSPEIDEEE